MDVCTQKSFAAYSSLRRRSAHRWKFVVKRSHFVLALMYIAFGVLGYLSDVKTNRTLTNIDYFLEFEGTGKNRVYFDILSAIVAFSLLLTVPVDCLVATTTCKRLYIKLFRRKKNRKNNKYVKQHICVRLVDWVVGTCCCWVVNKNITSDPNNDEEDEAARFTETYADNHRASNIVSHQDPHDLSVHSRLDLTNVSSTRDHHDLENVLSSGRGSASTYENAVDLENKYRGDTWGEDELLSSYTVQFANEAAARGVGDDNDVDDNSADTPTRTNTRSNATKTASATTTDKKGWRSFLTGAGTSKDTVDTSVKNVIHGQHSVSRQIHSASPNVDSDAARAISTVSSITNDSVDRQSSTLLSSNPNAVSTPPKKFHTMRMTTSEVMSIGSGSFTGSFDSSRNNSVDRSLVMSGQNRCGDEEEDSGPARMSIILENTSTSRDSVTSGVSPEHTPARTHSQASSSQVPTQPLPAHTHLHLHGRSQHDGIEINVEEFEEEKEGGRVHTDAQLIGNEDIQPADMQQNNNDDNSQNSGAQQVNPAPVPRPSTNTPPRTHSSKTSNSPANTSKFISAEYAAVRKANSSNAVITGASSQSNVQPDDNTHNINRNSAGRQLPTQFPTVRKTLSDNAVSTAPSLVNKVCDGSKANNPGKTTKRGSKGSFDSTVSGNSHQSDTPHLDALMAAMSTERRSNRNSRSSGSGHNSITKFGGNNSRTNSVRSNDAGGNVYYEPVNSHEFDTNDYDENLPDSGDEEDPDYDEDIEFTFDSQRVDIHAHRQRQQQRAQQKQQQRKQQSQHRPNTHRHVEGTLSPANAQDGELDGRNVAQERDDETFANDSSAYYDDSALLSSEQAPNNADDMYGDDIDEQHRILQNRRGAERLSTACNISEMGPVFLIWAFTLLLCASYEHFGLIGMLEWCVVPAR
jgi:hypothetical protein